MRPRLHGEGQLQTFRTEGFARKGMSFSRRLFAQPAYPRIEKIERSEFSNASFPHAMIEAARRMQVVGKVETHLPRPHSVGGHIGAAIEGVDFRNARLHAAMLGQCCVYVVGAIPQGDP